MNNSVTLSASRHKKYTGANKAYVAKIVGRSKEHTFEREFLGTKVDAEEPGLYEDRDGGRDSK